MQNQGPYFGQGYPGVPVQGYSSGYSPGSSPIPSYANPASSYSLPTVPNPAYFGADPSYYPSGGFPVTQTIPNYPSQGYGNLYNQSGGYPQPNVYQTLPNPQQTNPGFFCYYVPNSGWFQCDSTGTGVQYQIYYYDPTTNTTSPFSPQSVSQSSNVGYDPSSPQYQYPPPEANSAVLEQVETSDIPDPETEEQPKVKVTIKAFVKQENQELPKAVEEVKREKAEAAQARVAPVVVEKKVTCSACFQSQPDSEIRCSALHPICIDCAAKRYLRNETKCPVPNCKDEWTMFQIIRAHNEICGSIPKYAAERPQEYNLPLGSCICIGKNQYITGEKSEQPIEFPKKGHLVYNNALALACCPNGHILCKGCAERIITSADKKCPDCHKPINFVDDAPHCEAPKIEEKKA